MTGFSLYGTERIKPVGCTHSFRHLGLVISSSKRKHWIYNITKTYKVCYLVQLLIIKIPSIFPIRFFELIFPFLSLLLWEMKKFVLFIYIKISTFFALVMLFRKLSASARFTNPRIDLFVDIFYSFPKLLNNLPLKK